MATRRVPRLDVHPNFGTDLLNAAFDTHIGVQFSRSEERVYRSTCIAENTARRANYHLSMRTELIDQGIGERQTETRSLDQESANETAKLQCSAFLSVLRIWLVRFRAHVPLQQAQPVLRAPTDILPRDLLQDNRFTTSPIAAV